MANVLITFLGRSSPDLKRYRFPDDREERAIVAGLAVLAYLKNQKRPPDKLVVFGTSASRWDILVESLAVEGSRPSAEVRALRSHLGRKVDQASVTAADLGALTSMLTQTLEVTKCRLEIIPVGESEPEQVKLLGHLNNAVENGDCLTLDLTHALRHLPMLGLLSALQLERLKQVTIESIFYAALDLPEEPDLAQVIELDGLLHIARWIEVLNRYDSTGNYALFGEVLGKDGMPDEVVKDLQDAALWEQLQRFDTAVPLLKNVRDWLNENELAGAGKLFKDTLIERLGWIDQDPLARQKTLAVKALKRNDYFTATIFGFEAYVTVLMLEQISQGNKTPDGTFDYRMRNSVRLDAEEKSAKTLCVCGTDKYKKPVEPLQPLPSITNDEKAEFCKFKLYRDFQNLRNAFAHGSEPRKSIQGIINDPDTVRDKVKEAFRELLGLELPNDQAVAAGQGEGR